MRWIDVARLFEAVFMLCYGEDNCENELKKWPSDITVTIFDGKRMQRDYWGAAYISADVNRHGPPGKPKFDGFHHLAVKSNQCLMVREAQARGLKNVLLIEGDAVALDQYATPADDVDALRAALAPGGPPWELLRFGWVWRPVLYGWMKPSQRWDGKKRSWRNVNQTERDADARGRGASRETQTACARAKTLPQRCALFERCARTPCRCAGPWAGIDHFCEVRGCAFKYTGDSNQQFPWNEAKRYSCDLESSVAVGVNAGVFGRWDAMVSLIETKLALLASARCGGHSSPYMRAHDDAERAARAGGAPLGRYRSADDAAAVNATRDALAALAARAERECVPRRTNSTFNKVALEVGLNELPPTDMWISADFDNVLAAPPLVCQKGKAGKEFTSLGLYFPWDAFWDGCAIGAADGGGDAAADAECTWDGGVDRAQSSARLDRWAAAPLASERARPRTAERG